MNKVPCLADLMMIEFRLSFPGTIAALLQEIVNIYPMISPPNLNVSYFVLVNIPVLNTYSVSQALLHVIIPINIVLLRSSSRTEFAMLWHCSSVLHLTLKQDQHFCKVIVYMRL